MSIKETLEKSKKAKLLKGNPEAKEVAEIVVSDALEPVEEELRSLESEIDGVRTEVEDVKEDLEAKIDTIALTPGEDGIRGEIGPIGPKGDSIVGPQGERGEIGAQGEPGEARHGRDGRDGIDGKTLMPGVDFGLPENGRDGSPDLPEEIVFKLQSLKGKDRLDASAIKNLPVYKQQQAGGGGYWKRENGYLETIEPNGWDILLKGTDTYLNWNIISGETGYGFRENGGQMEFKHDGAEWIEVLGEAGADFLYLRLDGTNDPVTGNVNLQVTSSTAWVVSTTAGLIDYWKVDTNTTQTGALLQITDDVLGADFLSLRGADHGMEMIAATVDTAIANMNHNTWQLDINNTAANAAVYRGLLYNLNANNNFNITGSLQGVFVACLNNGTGTIDAIDTNTSFIFNVSTGIMTDVHGFTATMGSLGGTITRYTAFYVGSSVGTITNSALLGENDARFITGSSFHYNRNGTFKFVPISEASTGITFDSLDLTVATTTSGDVIITSVDDVTITGDLIDVTGPLRTDARRKQITEITASTYTALATDHHISIQRTDTGVHTLTLPAISATLHGQEFSIKDSDYNASVNNITVATTGADTIEEAASGTMTLDGEAWKLLANNTTKNWEQY